MISFSFIFSVAFFSLRSIYVLSQEGEIGHVIFVNVLYRHGDRSAIDTYHTDPYQNKSYWPEGFGQLSNKGKRQHYELGQWLRRRYDSLLTEQYSPDNIYIQSTDMDRTLMSAECNLAGMYPPRGPQVWNDDLPWQPIPIHTIPEKLDKVLAQQAPCPIYQAELMRVFRTDKKIRQLNESYSELFRWMSKNTGANISFVSAGWVRDTLYVENQRNLTLPQWTNTVFPEPLEAISVEIMKLATWTPTLTRLKTGLLLGEMIENMKTKIKIKTTKNVHVYSAHDETIINLLRALGAFNDMMVPYASCLMMELREDPSGSHFVTLYYRNSTTDGPYLMKIAGCTPVCPLDQFISLSQPLIPEDWEKECGFSDKFYENLMTYLVLLLVVAVAVLGVTLLCTYSRRIKVKIEP